MVDIPAVFRETYPIARKEHRCCECKRTIAVGQIYQLAEGLWDGEWSRFKTCIACDEMRQEIARLSDLIYDEGIAFCELSEHAREMGFEFPPVE